MVFKSPVHDELQPATVPQYYVEGDHEAIIPKELIEKITVFAYHFTVEFKSGITIDIEAQKSSFTIDNGSLGAFHPTSYLLLSLI
ncbi:hypothetical protein SAMN05216515_1164 [Eubacterium pyruvativorans]|uniref:Uncharacterized protein n=1 Tax=Eubacterium pyruvativorans TaxID=155865 RepID=A0A1I7HBW6_9FIRM|nr:hypothetical protein [Eubacterium pyruvativorans]SFO24235.1 hypothetical protein SAMN05216515_1164 [Eubacterium pyruvativorans]SFU58210.1 hypothetical protein SAMN05216508_1154 [Eubacterium pyruvativorans]